MVLYADNTNILVVVKGIKVFVVETPLEIKQNHGILTVCLSFIL
jgi:hypothetical protein